MIAPAAVATPAPQRELVYSFTFESVRSYAGEKAYGVDEMDPGGGGTFMFHNVNQHYIAPSTGGGDSQHRSGTLKIDVVRQEADGGLVLAVSESTGGAYGTPVACVAYGDTTVICDPNSDAGPEIPALAALLGKGFVDPSRLDDKRHWKILPQGSYGTTADYTIVKTDGALLDIVQSGVRTDDVAKSKTEIDGKIEYDPARSLPTRFEQSTSARTQQGVIYVNDATFASFALQSANGE